MALLRQQNLDTGCFIFVAGGEHLVYTPTERVSFKGYECGKTLRADWLHPYLEPSPTVLYIVLDWREVSVAHSDGTRTILRFHDESQVMGKHNKGGMSQQRMERNHEIAVHHWFASVEREVLDVVSRHHTSRIVVGGPGMTKDQWVKSIKSNPLRLLVCPHTYNTGYTDESQGIRELVAYSQ
jgi:peptide subunit release factor 1 (eRF1)